MRLEVLLVLQLVLPIFGVSKYTLPSAQKNNVDQPCQTDSDCYPWLACSNNVCSVCKKVGATCIPGETGFLAECCEGTSCLKLGGSNYTHCIPGNNKCSTDADCFHNLKCLFRLGECGYCKSDGEACTLPYDDLECCSSYCRIGEYGYGVCANASHFPPPPLCAVPLREAKLALVDSGQTDLTPEDSMTSSFNGVEEPSCLNEGENCTLRGDSWAEGDPECCYGYCKLIDTFGSAVCSNESIYHEETTMVPSTTTPRKFCLEENRNCNTKAKLGWWLFDVTECCDGFCDTSVFPDQVGVGLCKYIRLGVCRTHRDCQSNFDCVSGQCVTCQRIHSYCQLNSDCCSKNCSTDHTFYRLKHRTMCV